MTAITDLVDRARYEVAERLPSCQLALARDGELLTSETVGAARPGQRYPIWSCTKALVGGVVWQLVGEGLLEWNRTVASYIPEFGTNGKDVVTVEQCVLHTAGFPDAPLGPARWFTSEGRREAFSRWRLNWEPGSKYAYHPLSAYWVLAELIIEVTGRDYRDEVTTRVCEPLGLAALRLGVQEGDQHDVVDLSVVGVNRSTEADFAAAGLPYGGAPVVPPEVTLALNAPAAQSVGIPGGGAVGTAADVALYYQALLSNPGGLWDPAVLADATGTVRNTFPDVPKALPANRSRGLVIRGDHAGAERMMHFGPGTSPRTFGHDGAGGQIAWADPDSGLSFCFLTNGMEANLVREALRCQDFSRLAAACA